MSELWGIVRFPRLLSRDVEQFHQMRELFHGVPTGETEADVLPFAAIGASCGRGRLPRDPGAHHMPSQMCLRHAPSHAVVDNATTQGLRAALLGQRCDHLIQQELPFLFAAASRGPEAFVLMSDPAGLCPVYYGRRNGMTAFATKMLPLALGPFAESGVDMRAVYDFFAYDYVTGKRTLLDGVEVLAPGALLRMTPEGSSIGAYYRPLDTNREMSRQRPRDLANAFYDALRSTIATMVDGYKRIAIPLSGGLDSRALLACACRLHDKITAYTFGVRGCSDVLYARQIARRCKVEHAVLPIDGSFLPRWLFHCVYVTGGMVSCRHSHILSLADRMASEADVVLDGLGGDAMTGGHLKLPVLMAPRRGVGRALFRQHAANPGAPNGLKRLLAREIIEDSYHPQVVTEKYARRRPLWRGCHEWDLYERQRRFVQYGPHLLACFVDVRTPFYGRDVRRLLLSFPLLALLEQRVYVAMHARYLGGTAVVPDTLRGLPLTRAFSVRMAKKAVDALSNRAGWRTGLGCRQATDYAAWLRRPLRGYVRELLLDRFEPLHSWVRREELERLVDEHMSGGADHSQILCCLMTLRSWLAQVGNRQVAVSKSSCDDR